MNEALLVEATPGGRLMLRFGARGYAVEPATLLDRAEHLGRRMFGTIALLKVLGLAIVLSLPALPFVKSESASDTVTMLVAAPALLCFAYFLLGIGVHLFLELLEHLVFVLVILTLPLLILPPYRRWLFGRSTPVERRPGYVPAEALTAVFRNGDGKSSTVGVHFHGGGHATYVARGRDHEDLIRQFARIIAPRDFTPSAPTADYFRPQGPVPPAPPAPPPGQVPPPYPPYAPPTPPNWPHAH